MRRLIVVVAAIIAVVAGAVPAEAGRTQDQYQRLYEKVRVKHGSRAPGRNIVKYGLPRGGEPSKARLNESIEVLKRMLRPPPPQPAAVQTATATSYSTDGGYAGGALAAIRACESGGDYGAVDPSGTYRGAYQFDYGTWAGVGGSGDPAAASPAEQDMRAQMLYDQRGAAPWPVCGQ